MNQRLQFSFVVLLLVCFVSGSIFAQIPVNKIIYQQNFDSIGRAAYASWNANGRTQSAAEGFSAPANWRIVVNNLELTTPPSPRRQYHTYGVDLGGTNSMRVFINGAYFGAGLGNDNSSNDYCFGLFTDAPRVVNYITLKYTNNTTDTMKLTVSFNLSLEVVS
jgi:hypothetical protein